MIAAVLVAIAALAALLLIVRFSFGLVKIFLAMCILSAMYWLYQLLSWWQLLVLWCAASLIYHWLTQRRTINKQQP